MFLMIIIVTIYMRQGLPTTNQPPLASPLKPDKVDQKCYQHFFCLPYRELAMPTVSELFHILPLFQYNELALFNAITNSFNYSTYTRAGSYPRELFYISGGALHRASIFVFRVRIKGSLSNHTLSIRPTFFISNTSYTIGAVISLLYAFHNRKCSITAFCAKWQISYSSLCLFEKKFASDASRWKKVLISLKELCLLLHSDDHNPFCSFFTSPGDSCPMLFDSANCLYLLFFGIPP